MNGKNGLVDAGEIKMEARSSKNGDYLASIVCPFAMSSLTVGLIMKEILHVRGAPGCLS